MLSILQVFVIVLCIAFFCYVIYLVAKERLLLKYSLLWIVLTAATLVCALFTGPVYALASWLGFETPSNFIFFVGLFFLMAIALSLSVIVSKQAMTIKNLTQQIALVEKETQQQPERRAPEGEEAGERR